jgi:hypothetical protein
LMAANDTEMSELIQQSEDHTREFSRSWNDHIKKLKESAKSDMRGLQEIHQS